MARHRLSLARRGAALLALIAAVLGLHAVFGHWVAAEVEAWRSAARPPERLEAAFVRELAPAPPPAAPPRPAAPPPRRAAPARPPNPAAATPPAAVETSSAASAPEPAASEPAEAASAPGESVPDTDEAPTLAEPADDGQRTETPGAVAEAASAGPDATATAPGSGAASAPAFEWPPSTRLSYVLTGNYRGEVHGSAEVEWVHFDDRYQVHLDVVVGLPFAPLYTRRMLSDGTVGPDGLSPRVYDEQAKRAFQPQRRAAMVFEPAEIVLANGQRRPRPAGVQDTASQFVQLTWMFTTRPELLKVGNSFSIPLALPRNVDRWVYDVVGTETIYPPFGPVETFHVKPRRTATPGSDMTVELWFAPSLQYLPLRIRIHQSADTWIDLMIERPPLQAAPR